VTLREARLARFLSQQDLAEKSGVGRSTIVTIEAGTPPRLRTARLLAQALEYQPGEIEWPKNRAKAAIRKHGSAGDLEDEQAG